MIIFISFIEQMSRLPGAILASLMFIGGVAIEALFVVISTRILNWTIPEKLAALDQENDDKEPKRLTYPMFFRFYTPLIVTTIIYNLFMPIINAGLARSDQPDLTLSVFAVAWGLGMIVLSPFYMLHQIPLRYYEEGSKNRSIRFFIIIVAGLSALVMVLISFTHIGYYILRHWIGTSHEISILAADVLKLMCISPFLLAAREYYWGIMLKQRLTRFIWQGKLVNLVCLLAVLAAALAFNPANAAIVGVLSFIGGEAAEFVFLLWVSRHHLQAKTAHQLT